MAKRKTKKIDIDTIENTKLFFILMDKKITFPNEEKLEVRNREARGTNFLLHDGKGFVNRTREEVIEAVKLNHMDLIENYKG